MFTVYENFQNIVRLRNLYAVN